MNFVPSPTQIRCLHIIADYIECNQFSPTLREIAADMGCSFAYVNNYVYPPLVEKGCIRLRGAATHARRVELTHWGLHCAGREVTPSLKQVAA